jgi:hypothetical protein
MCVPIPTTTTTTTTTTVTTTWAPTTTTPRTSRSTVRVNASDYLITEEEFIQAVITNSVDIRNPNSTAKCPMPTNDMYISLVSQAQSAGGMYTKQELAMFLAQILWESDCLRATSEYACEKGCPGEYPNTGSGYPRREYFGRGYIQLVG